MDEIVDCITKPKFFQKLIIILAGYDQDINRLMAINPGLTSRFPEELEFAGPTPDACIQLLTTLLQKRKSDFLPKVESFDLEALEFTRKLVNLFSRLTQTANWANARDVQTISKAIFRVAIQSMRDRIIFVSEDLIITKINGMISERTSRATNQSASRNPMLDLSQIQALDRQPIQPILTTTSNPPAALEDKVDKEKPASPAPETPTNTIPRDEGVPDDIWHQLQLDKQAAQTAESQFNKLLDDERTAERAVNDLPPNPPASSKSSHSDLDAEANKQHEQRRLQELAKRVKLEELRRKREEEEKVRRKEKEIQQKLRHMGVCVAGFRWIKQIDGYRCAGGSHFISKEALGV
ncbi:hypothetical protein BDV12DRAFT_197937 [Aspergillus spectabilis]